MKNVEKSILSQNFCMTKKTNKDSASFVWFFKFCFADAGRNAQLQKLNLF